MRQVFVERMVAVRRPLIIAANILLTTISFFLALVLRFDMSLDDHFSVTWLYALGILLVFRLAAYHRYDLNKGYWRFVSVPEALSIFRAHFASSFAFGTSMLVLRFTTDPIVGFPRSIALLEFALGLLLCAGSRVLVRFVYEQWTTREEKRRGFERRDVVVLGGGGCGQLLIKTVLSNHRLQYRPIAVLDDNERQRGSVIHTVPIVGPLSDLHSFLESHPTVAAVIAAIPNLSSEKLAEIERVCASFHLPLKLLETFESVTCRDASEATPTLSIESILSREVEFEYEEQISESIRGKSVLVTGAGGSIGSELVRQILSFEPSKLILVDNSEFNLFSIERELSAKSVATEVHFLLADVVNQERLRRLFREHTPEIVFHAAAYKHVPLLEKNCYDGFVNNVVGTYNVLQVARTYGTKRFLLISSDKAVDPSSIMGCTKRIAELMVRNVAVFDLIQRSRDSSLGAMSTTVVRFGNVINSAGSVIPFFKKQILAGGPVTVTHPKMERYFMSIREAVRLVLIANTLGGRGEIYLLDMGKPILIVDVAKKLLALYGRRDIPIVFTGLRPGEKLTEELHSSFELKRKTEHRKIFALEFLRIQGQDVFAWVSAVRNELDSLNEEQIGALIRNFVSKSDDLPQVANGGHSLEVREANG